MTTRSGQPSERSLRVGVMLDSLTPPAWIARIIGQVQGTGCAEIALVVLNVEPPAPQPRFARLRSPRRQHLLFGLYSRVDARVFRCEPDAFAEVSVRDELAGVPHLEVVPLRPTRFEHRFDASTVREIRDADLDVLLRFGFNIIRGEILDSARYGVWSYHHGDNRQYRGAPAFFWEMYEVSPVTGTMLGVLTEELDAARTLYRSFSATDVTSLHRGRNAAYWKSAEFVVRRLTDLHRRGWSPIESSAQYTEVVRYDKPIYRAPTNGQMVRFLARLGAGMAFRQARKALFRDTWYVGYRRTGSAGPPPFSASRLRRAPREERFRLIASPPGRYYADPFVVEHDGRHHLFFEDYDFATGRGMISEAAFDGRGELTRIRSVLERPYHLSYPFVFRWHDDWFMVPETREQRTIELFKASQFPHVWELERILARDVEAVDPTILEHDGRLWLFTNVAVPGGPIADELFVYHAPSLADEWTPHPMNPVVSDVRRARPAGRVMRHDGMLIRPSQDASRRYGFATVFNRITSLSPTEYAEEPVGRLDPGWRRGNLATHTFNSDGTYEVVDAERRAVRLLSGRSRSARLRRSSIGQSASHGLPGADVR